MTTLAERLKAARKRAKLTQAQVAEKVGVKQPTYQALESGKVEKTAFLTDFARVLGVSSEWLATGEGEMKVSAININANVSSDVDIGFRLVPVLNSVQAGVFNCVFDDEYDEFLPVGRNIGKCAYWLKIKGQSMTPEFNEGDYILVDPEMQPTPSDFVVALKKGCNEVTFKKYRPRGFDDNGNEYCQLVPLNPEFPIIDSRFEPFDICAVLIEHRKRYK